MPLTITDYTNSSAGTGSVNIGAGSDVTVYGPALRRIYVGATGDVKVDTMNPASGGGAPITLTYKNAPVGYLRCRATKVYATGTTATSMIGEF